ncbi:hypothetical protein SDC9_186859 [bioreactor metagenome]|uniref:Uncharacterized protein n=1 Tax=bioreactor metagenome TaxID=1076179 RepID=A0A645HJY1_9ZZZZ
MALVEEEGAEEGAYDEVETERFTDGAEDQHEDDDDAEQRFRAEDADHCFRYRLDADVAAFQPFEELAHGEHDDGEQGQFERGQADGGGGVAQSQVLRQVEDDTEDEQRGDVVDDGGGQCVLGDRRVQHAEAVEQLDRHR